MPKYCTKLTVTASQKNPEASKCSDLDSINLITNEFKIVATILRRRVEMTFEEALVEREDQVGFRREEEAENAIAMLRIISVRTLDMDEELWLAS
jgi:hypothetical protein